MPRFPNLKTPRTIQPERFSPDIFQHLTLTSRRGRIVRRYFEISSDWIGWTVSRKPATNYGHSFFLGEGKDEGEPKH